MTTVTHTTPHPAAEDSGDGRISKDAWDAPHEAQDLKIKVVTMVNYVIADGTALYFHETRGDDDGSGNSTGIWLLAEPDRFTIQEDIVDPRVEVHVTTLGTNYTGPSNAEVFIIVVKNWDGVFPYLQDIVAAERFDHANGVNARLDAINQSIDPLEAGDVLQVLLTSATGSLLVESNPSEPPESGSDYRTQPGNGMIGTHFILRG